MRGSRPAYTLETFLAKRVIVNPETGCWDCQGSPLHHGYQAVSIKGRSWSAHRWVFTQAKGEIPDGLTLDHLCRNTGCVNPEHLEPVTHAENNRRARLVVCRRGLHPMVAGNLYESKGNRRCRACHLLSGAAQREKRRMRAAEMATAA